MHHSVRRVLTSSCLSLALLPVFLFAAGPRANPSALVPPGFPLPPVIPSENELAAVDALLKAGDGDKAFGAIQGLVRKNLETPRSLGLTPVLGRLAVAEALLGRDDEARWHWDVAQALSPSSPALAGLANLGPAGARVAAWGSRGWDEVPAGVEAAGPGVEGFQPPKRASGDNPAVSAVTLGEPGPKWVQIKLVVDAEGRPSRPVAKGPSNRFTFETLEGLRAWRFEPAKKGGVAVPGIFRLNVNTPQEKPLREMLGAVPELEQLETRLRAGADAKLQRDLDDVWRRDLDQGLLPHDQQAALLTLRALALAAGGNESEAICLSQAAQGLRPDLYHADLDPYGAAGRLLERNRYGAARAAKPPQLGPGGEMPPVSGTPAIEKPTLLRSSQKPPRFTQQALKHGSTGNILVAAIIDTGGAVRDPIVFGAGESARGLDFAALGAICQWRFEPARQGGAPVAVFYDLTMNFAMNAGRAPRSPVGRIP